MNEEYVEVNYETISSVQKQNLLEVTGIMMNALSVEDFTKIMLIYKNVADRLLKESE